MELEIKLNRNKKASGEIAMIDKIGDKCIGCGACESACTFDSINLLPNNEGFLYPVVDKNKCINCNVCDSVCPVLFNGLTHDIANAEIIGIGSKKENEQEIIKSASAGVFFFIAKHIIESGGYVYGAVFDNNHKVKHICGKTIDDLKKMQTSKYVQSDTTEIYKNIQIALRKNVEKPILFCGTPCQCVGLKSFLHQDYKNLYLLDLVCHGVPSPLAFKKYLGYLQETKKEPCEDFQFRCKHKGWNYHGYMSSYVKYNKHYWPTVCDPYMSSFLKMTNYRESCYSCQYNTQIKVSDITLADFAGVRKIAPDFFRKSGCSEIFIHTDKGNELFKSIINNIDFIQLKKEQLDGYHSILSKERTRPVIRNSIYKDITTSDNKTFVEKNLKKTIRTKSIIRFYIPDSLRKIITKNK